MKLPKAEEQPESPKADLSPELTDEQIIKELTKAFAWNLNERDYKNFDGRAEYHLYTVDHLVELIKNNDEQNTAKFFKDYKIKSQYRDCEFLSINFSTDRIQAEVVCNVTICITSAEDKYFKELNKTNQIKISPGTPFRKTYKLLINDEKGSWKIDSFKILSEK